MRIIESRDQRFSGWLQRLVSRGIAVVAWLYAGILVTVWLLIYLTGDRWWLGTVLLFGPRWIWGAPLFVLVPVSAVARRRTLWILLASAVVVVWPIMGICVHGSWMQVEDPAALRVLTLNTDAAMVDPEALARFVVTSNADVVALQECNAEMHFRWPYDWHVRQAGPLLLASRYPIVSVETSTRATPVSPWPPIHGLCCELETPRGLLAVCTVHLRTARYGLAEVLDRSTILRPSRKGKLIAETENRRAESRQLREWLAARKLQPIIAGDFNMPVESAIYRQCWSRYTNAFSKTGWGFGHTKFTPVGSYRYGARIDHVLSGPDWQPRRCWVGPDVGPEHRPVLAELVRQRDRPRAD